MAAFGSLFKAGEWGHTADNESCEEGDVGLDQHRYLLPTDLPLPVVEHVPHPIHDGPRVHPDPGEQLEQQGHYES